MKRQYTKPATAADLLLLNSMLCGSKDPHTGGGGRPSTARSPHRIITSGFSATLVE